jgi:hypothetical protein
MIDFGTLWMKQKLLDETRYRRRNIHGHTSHALAPMGAYQHGDKQGLGEDVDKTNTTCLDLLVLAYN